MSDDLYNGVAPDPNESWLHANIMPIVALIILSLTGFFDTIVLFKAVQASENITIMIVTAINGFAATVVGFLFGNSMFRAKPQERPNVPQS